MKVLVTGGRDFADAQFVYEWLDAIHATKPITLLIEGGAKGADALCRAWANHRGVQVQTMHADWDRWGRQAGILRNIDMLNQKPELVASFPGGRGTDHCSRTGERMGIPVLYAKHGMFELAMVVKAWLERFLK